MKFNLLILLGITILLNQNVSANFYDYNPFRNDNDLWASQYGDVPTYRRADYYDDLSYRGYNTYNFNNYVPLHYGLFSEDETKDFIDRSIQYYKETLAEEEVDSSEARRVRRYKRRFHRRNPATYQDWYGLSRYYPTGYNSYRLF